MKNNNNMFRNINSFFNYISNKVGVANNIGNKSSINNIGGKVGIYAFHISTGDNFTMYASVCHYAKIYKKVIIFALFRNRYTITQLYKSLVILKLL